MTNDQGYEASENEFDGSALAGAEELFLFSHRQTRRRRDWRCAENRFRTKERSGATGDSCLQSHFRARLSFATAAS